MTNDNPQTQSAEKIPRKRLTERKKLILWVLFGLSAPFLYLAWGLLRPADAIQISEETTYLTGPVFADQYVDVADEWNRICQTGVPANTKIDVDNLLNAITVLKQQVLPISPDPSGLANLDSWSPETHARFDGFLELLKHNQGVLPLPRISGADKYRLMWIESAELQKLMDVCDGMGLWLGRVQRSRIRDILQDGDQEGALREFESMAEYQRFLLRVHTLLNTLVVGQSQLNLMNDLLNYVAADRLTTAQSRVIINSMPAIDLQRTARLMKLCRLQMLSAVFGVHSHYPMSGSPIFARPWYQELITAMQNRWRVRNTDWNQVCRRTNQFFDDIEHFLEDAKTHHSVTDLQSPTMRPETPEKSWTLTRAATTNNTLHWMADNAEPQWKALIQAVVDTAGRRLLFDLALQVHEFHAAHDRFPDSLATFRPPEKSNPLASLQSVTYQNTESGYVLTMKPGEKILRVECKDDQPPQFH